ncbi:MAG: hypothetical protein E6G49_09305 [Actinobacteria bacterium]|nr:MAG: hypothetical protein E6G49_09305 [Actinomycetota bacterium]
MWEFGDQVRFSWVMGGLARSYGSDHYWEQTADWLDVAAESGMPVDARLWSQNPIDSTYPACQAVKAAAEQGSEAAYRYLRRLREGLMTERKKLDHTEALVGEAGPAGLDVERFRIDLASNEITEAFAADLDAVRNPPDRAREQGGVGETEGHERVTFPSAVFRGEDGTERGVWGWNSYDAYRDAAVATGAEPGGPHRPDPALRSVRDARARGADGKAHPRSAGGALVACPGLAPPAGRRARRHVLGVGLEKPQRATRAVGDEAGWGEHP